jgi:LAS superfamily LD-carboxypeptidase LdcB
MLKMRVLEPKHLKKPKKAGKKRVIPRWVSVFVVLAFLCGGAVYLYALRQVAPSESNNAHLPETSQPADDPFDKTQRPLKMLSGDEFKQLYQSVALPNTQEIVDPPPITGDDAADARIRARAEARGYRLSHIPMGAIVKVEDEPRLDTDDLLQPLAAEAWSKLRDTARRAGYPVSLISAYRSPEYQQGLFAQRLYDRGVTTAQLASGAADSVIDEVLQITAVPGYSRHHTGYTVDLWCEDGSLTFLDSICYDWISADNYKNAMEHGWIPSYPEGASEQGPEPEPWEYVWVGDAVRK